MQLESLAQPVPRIKATLLHLVGEMTVSIIIVTICSTAVQQHTESNVYHCPITIITAVCYHHVLLLAGEDDLRDVISAVTNLAGRWKDLGISLGLRPSDLDTILSANPHSPRNCLMEMLLQWLKQSYNVCMTQKLHLLCFISLVH